MARNILAVECQGCVNSGVSNILAVYAQATAAEVRQGMAWYSDALADAVRISNLYGVELKTVVMVACALSPRLAWFNNMPAAEMVIRWYVSGGYVPSIAPYADGSMKIQRTRHNMSSPVITDDANIPAIPGPTRTNIVKALWILQGHTWVLRGQKVQSFLDNILNCETSQAVTVDSHAIQVWRGVLESGTYAVPPTWYKVIEADYRIAAKLVGLTPLQLQAVVWLTKKRLHVKQRVSAKEDTAALVAALEGFLA
jgi:hypothetical protein